MPRGTKCAPDGDDGREKNKESENVDVPGASETVQCYEEHREGERHST